MMLTVLILQLHLQPDWVTMLYYEENSVHLHVDSVEVMVATPDVHHLAVAAERRRRKHPTTGCKAPDLAAGHRVDSVEVVWSAANTGVATGWIMVYV